MAKSKLDLMYKKEQEEELKKKYGVKQTTPNVKILMGKNEEKMKTLTGDSNFGSTVKNAFVKGATLQAQNQTMLAQNTANNVRNVAQNYGAANASYGSAYNQYAQNVGGTTKNAVDHWASVNAANSKAQLQQGVNNYNAANQVMQEYGPIWGMTTGVTGSDQTGASIWGYRNAPGNMGNQLAAQQTANQIRNQIADGGIDVLGHALAARGLSGGKTLDSYNKFLEYSATGRISDDKTVTPGVYSKIVDEAVADFLTKRYGDTAGNIYSNTTKAFDDVVSVGLGPVVGAVKSAFDVGGESLEQARLNGANNQQAILYGAANGLRASMSEPIENMVKRAVKSESLGEAIHGIAGNFADEFTQEKILRDNSEYSNLVNHYYQNGFSKEQAQKIAKHELAKANIQSASEDMLYRKMFTPMEVYLKYGRR